MTLGECGIDLVDGVRQRGGSGGGAKWIDLA